MALATFETDPLNRAREAFATLLMRDVLESAGAYDAEIVANPWNYAYRFTEGMPIEMVKRFTSDLRAERRRIARLTA
jgi:hypothetical protein